MPDFDKSLGNLHFFSHVFLCDIIIRALRILPTISPPNSPSKKKRFIFFVCFFYFFGVAEHFLRFHSKKSPALFIVQNFPRFFGLPSKILPHFNFPKTFCIVFDSPPPPVSKNMLFSRHLFHLAGDKLILSGLCVSWFLRRYQFLTIPCISVK